MKSYRTILLGVIAAAGFGWTAQAAEISGAGATFPYPIYAKWAAAYADKTGIKLNYQSIGSGGGIAQINAKTVDFGASDMPLKPDVLEKDGLTQFPPVIGGEVMVVNLPGIKPGQMTLDGPTIADIYLGKIAKWNDPAIAKLNPGLKLPIDGDRRRSPLGRLGHDLHLHRLSVEGQPGVEGQGQRGHLGRNGRSGSAARAMRACRRLTSRTMGAIGYVEYAYALQNKLTYTKLVNREGVALEPEHRTCFRPPRPMPIGRRHPAFT